MTFYLFLIKKEKAPLFSLETEFFVNYSIFRKLHPKPITRKMLFQQEPVKETCPLCNFTVRNKNLSNSTPRDLLLVSSVGTIRNVVPLMRTLRTTGSKCSVVLLTDDQAYIDPISLRIVTECGLQIIRCGNMELPKIGEDSYKWSAYSYIYYYLRAFLSQNIDKFDRVIICDLFDVVFQGDPFNTQVTYDYINAIDEGVYLKDSEYNIRWIHYAGPVELTQEDLDTPYICSGYFSGSAKNMLHLLDVFCEYVDFATNTPDQGIFNYLFIKGKQFGLKKNPFRVNELVHHTVVSKNIHMKGYRTLGNIPVRWNNNYYASVIHQYYKSKYLVKDILKVCPRESTSQTKYVAKWTESRIRFNEILMHFF